MKISETAFFIKCFISILAIFLLISCGEAPSENSVALAQSGFASGPTEKTLAQKHKLDFTLPVSEEIFLRTIFNLNLRYEIVAERGIRGIMPTPIWSDSFDVSKAKKCYQIYGDMDVKQHTKEGYVAYSDQNDQIVYVENAFQY